MKLWKIMPMLALAAIVLVGCGGGEAAPMPADEGGSGGEVVSVPADEGGGGASGSVVLDTSYSDALDVRSQLMLGTMQLEGTGNAVTAKQAKALLPLWQALQGGVTAQDEVDAVLKQIEGTMTSEQVAAIAAMQLTQDDLQGWMQSHGLEFGAGQGSSDEPGQASPGGGQPGDGQELSPEMATRQAQFAEMSEEERAAMLATREAGGGMPAGSMPASGGAGGGARQSPIMLNPLIDLLTERAAE